jgi:hypothetical protein
VAVTPPPPPTTVTAGLSFLERLTPKNALAILLLLCGLVPAYVVYRLVTDPALLDRFLSAYAVEPTSTACRIVRARERGEDFSYAVTTGIAFEGQTRYTIGAIMSRLPTEEEQQTLCVILQTMIDALHGLGPPPDVIWQVEDIQGREGEKGER